MDMKKMAEAAERVRQAQMIYDQACAASLELSRAPHKHTPDEKELTEATRCAADLELTRAKAAFAALPDD